MLNDVYKLRGIQVRDAAPPPGGSDFSRSVTGEGILLLKHTPPRGPFVGRSLAAAARALLPWMVVVRFKFSSIAIERS